MTLFFYSVYLTLIKFPFLPKEHVSQLLEVIQNGTFIFSPFPMNILKQHYVTLTVTRGFENKTKPFTVIRHTEQQF